MDTKTQPLTIFREYQSSSGQKSDRSAGDRARHRQKVKQSIKDNLSDIVADESLIGKHGDKVIKIPIKGIKEYRFVYGNNDPQAASGDGTAQPGQVVGKKGGKPQQGAGKGQAGDQKGEDIYETEITLDELKDLLFEELKLPNLRKTAKKEIIQKSRAKKDGYRKAGIKVRLDKKRTAINRIKRQISSQRELGQKHIKTKGNQEIEEAIKELYLCNKSTTEIEAELGISEKAINQSLKRAELLRPPKVQGMYALDHEAFAELRDEAIYWAGFIMADGNVSDNNDLQIHLSAKDLAHLEKFYTFLDFEQLKFREGAEYNDTFIDSDGNKKCYLKVKSIQLCQDLAKFYNIGPRKSLTCVWPSNLTPIQQKIFLTGVFDGDGCICVTKKDYAAFTISSGSEEFLIGLRDFLTDQGLTHRPISNGTGDFELRYYAKKDLERLYSILYKTSENIPYLERKHSIFYEYLNMDEKFGYSLRDRVYKHMEVKPKKQSNAAIIFIMDVSGSMDQDRKFLARSFFYVLYEFIRTKYEKSELVFISHTTEAEEVTEDQFFHKGESGGTFISSGLNKAIEVITQRYNPSLWNNYVFHMSDGDNFDSDNPAAARAMNELCELSNLVGYGEIKTSSWGSSSSMIEYYKDKIDHDNYKSVIIKDKSDIWPRLKEFLSIEEAVAAALEA